MPPPARYDLPFRRHTYYAMYYNMLCYDIGVGSNCEAIRVVYMIWCLDAAEFIQNLDTSSRQETKMYSLTKQTTKRMQKVVVSSAHCNSHSYSQRTAKASCISAHSLVRLGPSLGNKI